MHTELDHDSHRETKVTQAINLARRNSKFSALLTSVGNLFKKKKPNITINDDDFKPKLTIKTENRKVRLAELQSKLNDKVGNYQDR